MSASAIKSTDQESAIETDDTCKVVVFYENSAARAGAMSVCERLVEQFTEDLDFEFRWWKFGRLTDTALARHATEIAQSADIVMFCPERIGLPPEVAEWLDGWASSGLTSNGAMTLVIPQADDSATAMERLLTIFRGAAQRLGMDFLNVTIPPHAIKEEPITPTAYTSLRSEQPHLQHWGINE